MNVEILGSLKKFFPEYYDMVEDLVSMINTEPSARKRAEVATLLEDAKEKIMKKGMLLLEYRNNLHKRTAEWYNQSAECIKECESLEQNLQGRLTESAHKKRESLLYVAGIRSGIAQKLELELETFIKENHLDDPNFKAFLTGFNEAVNRLVIDNMERELAELKALKERIGCEG